MMFVMSLETDPPLCALHPTLVLVCICCATMSSSVPSGRTAAITAAVAVAGALLMYKLRRPANSDASATATAPAADAVAPPPSPSKASSSGASAAEVDATNGPESQLEFCLNGAVQRLGGTGQAPVDPSISLNDYIRRFTPFKGTKLACGEGGCGACAVMLTRVEPSTGEVCAPCWSPVSLTSPIVTCQLRASLHRLSTNL